MKIKEEYPAGRDGYKLHVIIILLIIIKTKFLKKIFDHFILENPGY